MSVMVRFERTLFNKNQKSKIKMQNYCVASRHINKSRKAGYQNFEF